MKKIIWAVLSKFGSDAGTKVLLNFNWGAVSVLIAVIGIVLARSNYKKIVLAQGVVECLYVRDTQVRDLLDYLVSETQTVK